MRYGQVNDKVTGTAAETVTWSSQEVPPGTEVKEFFFSMSATALDFDALSRIKVKAGGSLIYDVNELQLAALIGFYSKKAGPAATDTRFNIPFYLGAAPGIKLGAPPRNLSVELDIDGTPSAAGTASMGYQLGPADTTHYPMLLGSDANVAASAVRRGFPITQPGIIRGLIFPDTGDIDRVIITIGNVEIFNLSGPLMIAAQEVARGTTVTTNLYVMLPLLPIITGATQVYLDTGAGFGGVSEEIAIHSFVPVQKAAA